MDQRYNEQLEALVEARTAELRATNEELQQELDAYKEAEETLQLARLTVDNVVDTMFWMDSEARIIDVNKAACNTLGYTREELLTMTLFDVDPDFTAERWREAWSELKKRGMLTRETRHRTKDGRIFPVEIAANFIRFKGRELDCAFARDITKRKQAEQALRESEERLRQVVRVSRIGILDHDHRSDIIYWSPELRKHYGWDQEEPVTLTKIIDQAYPEDQERIKEAVRRAHDPAGDGLFDIEHRIIRRDGAIRWLSTRSQTFFEQEGGVSRPVRTIGAVLDVTEAKLAEEAQAKLEEQLRQAQKLEGIGRLAGGIAHDFNNLLVPMIGYTELGQASLSPDDKLYADLEKIKTAAERAANLTKQLLAFSRRQMLEVQLFDLNEVITEFQEMLRRLITEDIEVRILMSPTPCLLRADQTQIEQLLLNLSVNASDAMPNGGKLIIETDNVYLDQVYAQTHSETEPGNYVMLSFSDTGHGMDAETQKHIFEPFFTTKEQGKGTGLGLAMVFGIVKQHQGNIWVYSEPNKGTTFKIYLPQSEEIIRSDPVASPSPTSIYGTETVLVVEDEALVRKLACETLEAYGYTVLEAQSPEHGLQLAFAYEDTIHLLLTDVIMPGMNGRELYEKLADVLPNLKVLYISGYADNVIGHHGILEEGVNFLQKPFTIRDLAQKVRQVLD